MLTMACRFSDPSDSPRSDGGSPSCYRVLVIFAVSGAATSTVLVRAAAAAFITLSRPGSFVAADKRSMPAPCRRCTPILVVCRGTPTLGQSAEARIVHLFHYHWSAKDLLPNGL